MSYNIQHLSTAGRATIFTVITGVFCFAAAFIFNLGAAEFNQAIAQQGDTSATTSVTVVNLPPNFTVGATEQSTSSPGFPTNSGDTITFTATAVDTNGEDYWLLICSQNATPTASGGTAPTCTSGTQWAISALTGTGVEATAATTTTETTLTGTPFQQENVWFAFVCDDNSQDQQCTGTSGTSGSLPLPQPQDANVSATSSPFYVNNPPVFSGIFNNGPADPGASVTHFSTSSDSDNSTTTDSTDAVQLFVCATAGFDYVAQTCTGVELASTTVFASANATATDPIQIPTQDGLFNSFPYIIDNHGHAATSSLQGATSTFLVANVLPDMSQVASQINLGGVSSTLELLVESNETTGFVLDFEVYDANSCVNTSSSSEIIGYELSIYRSSSTDAGNNSSTTCRTGLANAGDYDPNDCYTSSVPTPVWNLTCTASTTACSGPNDTTDAFSCTFPLWYIADPTDSGSRYENSDWFTQIAAVDEIGTGTPSQSTNFVDVASFLSFDLQTFEIPYGALAPGEDTDDNAPGGLGTAGNPASSTIIATGNVGIDQRLSGSSMCPTFTGTSTPCDNNPNSTIPDINQVFSTTSTDTYADLNGNTNFELSSTSDKELEINIPKSSSTSTPASGITYWGIEIPGTINTSGDYSGLNTFIAVTAETVDWE